MKINSKEIFCDIPCQICNKKKTKGCLDSSDACVPCKLFMIFQSKDYINMYGNECTNSGDCYLRAIEEPCDACRIRKFYQKNISLESK